MGSFFSQLQAVVDMWRNEVNPFARFFANLYGKYGPRFYDHVWIIWFNTSEFLNFQFLAFLQRFKGQI